MTLAEMFRTHQRRVYCLALTYRDRGIEADDLAQEVWLRALHYSFRGDCDPWLWLARLTRTTFISLLRRRMAEKRGHEEQFPETFDAAQKARGADEDLISRQELAGMLTHLRQLPSDLRDAVLAVDLHEESPSAYAARIGISEVAARQRLFRARTKLRKSK